MKGLIKIMLVSLLLVGMVGCADEDVEVIDGGPRSNNRQLSPLVNIEGSLQEFNIVVKDEISDEFSLKEVNGIYELKHNRDGKEETMLVDKLTSESINGFIQTCGINNFNGFNVYTNGIDNSVDYIYCTAKYSSGEELFIEGNGGDRPEGFDDVYKDIRRFLMDVLSNRSDINASLDEYMQKIYDNDAFAGLLFIKEVEGPFDSLKTLLEDTAYKDVEFLYSIDFDRFIDEGPGNLYCIIPSEDTTHVLVLDHNRNVLYEGDNKPIYILKGNEEIYINTSIDDMVYEFTPDNLGELAVDLTAQ